MSDDIKVSKAGVGDPTSPLYGQLLSVEDERRLDEKGREVVKGKPWGDAGTGMYLVVALHTVPMYADKIQVGRTEIDLSRIKGGYKLDLMVSPYGKPTFNQPIVGACLELPDDLALDAIKRQYVVEWLIETAFEALDERQVKFRESPYLDEFQFALAAAADKAIAAARL